MPKPRIAVQTYLPARLYWNYVKISHQIIHCLDVKISIPHPDFLSVTLKDQCRAVKLQVIDTEDIYEK